MRLIILLAVASILTGCMGSGESLRDRDARETKEQAQASCSGFGYTLDTPDYNQCVANQINDIYQNRQLRKLSRPSPSDTYNKIMSNYDD